MTTRSDIISIFINYGWLILISFLLICYCCLIPSIVKCYRDFSETRFRVISAEASSIRPQGEESGSQRTTTSDIPVVSVNILDGEGDSIGISASSTASVACLRPKVGEVCREFDEQKEMEEEKLAEAHLVSTTYEHLERTSEVPNGSIQRNAMEASTVGEMHVEEYSREVMQSLRGRGIRPLMLS